jgi:uncharacterized protein (DUF983 family)
MPLSERDLAPAVLHGLAGRCPACGKSPLFARFLEPVAACPACKQDWSHQRADDFPAYLVVLLLGHILVPLVIEANHLFPLSALTQMIAWPLLAVLLALLLIQPAKGAVIALQWARRMHGFGTPKI